MASENDASCESDPNFAVICGFIEKFGATCGLTNIDFLDLQEMLENTQEVSPELIDLHIKLLRKARRSVSSEKWERALIKLCHTFCSQDAWELERFGYKKSRITSKLRILKHLLEIQFDFNQKFKNDINKMSADDLRTQPLGKDRLGHAYWCLCDEACQIRVYKEDPDEESWTLVAKDRTSLVSLISQLGTGDSAKSSSEPVSNEDSNSVEVEKPVLDTGQSAESSNSEPEKKLAAEEAGAREPTEADLASELENGESEKDHSDGKLENGSLAEKPKQDGLTRDSEEKGEKQLHVILNPIVPALGEEKYSEEDSDEKEKEESDEKSSESFADQKKTDEGKSTETERICEISEGKEKSNDTEKLIEKEKLDGSEESEEDRTDENPTDENDESSEELSNNSEKEVGASLPSVEGALNLSSKSSEPSRVEVECQTQDNSEAYYESDSESQLGLDLTYKPKLSLRIKPLNELLGQSGAQEAEKKEFIGIKGKYIRGEFSAEKINPSVSTYPSSMRHRRAVYSASYDAISYKRCVEEEEYEEPARLKRPRLDRPTLLGNKYLSSYINENNVDEAVEDEIEEPLMLVQGEGSGYSNESGNLLRCSEMSPIIGEEVEDPVLYVLGEGSGADCQTGNEDAKEDSSGANVNKNKTNLNVAKDGEFINSDTDGLNQQDSKCNLISPVKVQYKLGTVLDSKTDKIKVKSSSVKKSRWDIVPAVKVATDEIHVEINADLDTVESSASSDIFSNEHIVRENENLPDETVISTGKVKELVTKFESICESQTDAGQKALIDRCHDLSIPEAADVTGETSNSEIKNDDALGKPAFFFGSSSSAFTPASATLQSASLSFGASKVCGTPAIAAEDLSSISHPNDSDLNSDLGDNDGEPPSRNGEPPSRDGEPPSRDGEPPSQAGEPPSRDGEGDTQRYKTDKQNFETCPITKVPEYVDNDKLDNNNKNVIAHCLHNDSSSTFDESGMRNLISESSNLDLGSSPKAGIEKEDETEKLELKTKISECDSSLSRVNIATKDTTNLLGDGNTAEHLQNQESASHADSDQECYGTNVCTTVSPEDKNHNEDEKTSEETCAKSLVKHQELESGTDQNTGYVSEPANEAETFPVNLDNKSYTQDVSEITEIKTELPVMEEINFAGPEGESKNVCESENSGNVQAPQRMKTPEAPIEIGEGHSSDDDDHSDKINTNSQRESQIHAIDVSASDSSIKPGSQVEVVDSSVLDGASNLKNKDLDRANVWPSNNSEIQDHPCEESDEDFKRRKGDEMKLPNNEASEDSRPENSEALDSSRRHAVVSENIQTDDAGISEEKANENNSEIQDHPCEESDEDSKRRESDEMKLSNNEASEDSRPENSEALNSSRHHAVVSENIQTGGAGISEEEANENNSEIHDHPCEASDEDFKRRKGDEMKLPNNEANEESRPEHSEALNSSRHHAIISENIQTDGAGILDEKVNENNSEIQDHPCEESDKDFKHRKGDEMKLPNNEANEDSRPENSEALDSSPHHAFVSENIQTGSAGISEEKINEQLEDVTAENEDAAAEMHKKHCEDGEDGVDLTGENLEECTEKQVEEFTEEHVESPAEECANTEADCSDLARDKSAEAGDEDSDTSTVNNEVGQQSVNLCGNSNAESKAETVTCLRSDNEQLKSAFGVNFQEVPSGVGLSNKQNFNEEVLSCPELSNKTNLRGLEISEPFSDTCAAALSSFECTNKSSAPCEAVEKPAEAAMEKQDNDERIEDLKTAVHKDRTSQEDNPKDNNELMGELDNSEKYPEKTEQYCIKSSFTSHHSTSKGDGVLETGKDSAGVQQSDVNIDTESSLQNNADLHIKERIAVELAGSRTDNESSSKIESVVENVNAPHTSGDPKKNSQSPCDSSAEINVHEKLQNHEVCALELPSAELKEGEAVNSSKYDDEEAINEAEERQSPVDEDIEMASDKGKEAAIDEKSVPETSSDGEISGGANCSESLDEQNERQATDLENIEEKEQVDKSVLETAEDRDSSRNIEAKGSSVAGGSSEEYINLESSERKIEANDSLLAKKAGLDLHKDAMEKTNDSQENEMKESAQKSEVLRSERDVENKSEEKSHSAALNAAPTVDAEDVKLDDVDEQQSRVNLESSGRDVHISDKLQSSDYLEYLENVLKTNDVSERIETDEKIEKVQENSAASRTEAESLRKSPETFMNASSNKEIQLVEYSSSSESTGCIDDLVDEITKEVAEDAENRGGVPVSKDAAVTDEMQETVATIPRESTQEKSEEVKTDETQLESKALEVEVISNELADNKNETKENHLDQNDQHVRTSTKLESLGFEDLKNVVDAGGLEKLDGDAGAEPDRGEVRDMTSSKGTTLEKHDLQLSAGSNPIVEIDRKHNPVTQQGENVPKESSNLLDTNTLKEAESTKLKICNLDEADLVKLDEDVQVLKAFHSTELQKPVASRENMTNSLEDTPAKDREHVEGTDEDSSENCSKKVDENINNSTKMGSEGDVTPKDILPQKSSETQAGKEDNRSEITETERIKPRSPPDGPACEGMQKPSSLVENKITSQDVVDLPKDAGSGGDIPLPQEVESSKNEVNEASSKELEVPSPKEVESNESKKVNETFASNLTKDPVNADVLKEESSGRDIQHPRGVESVVNAGSTDINKSEVNKTESASPPKESEELEQVSSRRISLPTEEAEINESEVSNIESVSPPKEPEELEQVSSGGDVSPPKKAENVIEVSSAKELKETSQGNSSAEISPEQQNKQQGKKTNSIGQKKTSNRKSKQLNKKNPDAGNDDKVEDEDDIETTGLNRKTSREEESTGSGDKEAEDTGDGGRPEEKVIASDAGTSNATLNKKSKMKRKSVDNASKVEGEVTAPEVRSLRSKRSAGKPEPEIVPVVDGLNNPHGGQKLLPKGRKSKEKVPKQPNSSAEAAVSSNAETGKSNTCTNDAAPSKPAKKPEAAPVPVRSGLRRRSKTEEVSKKPELGKKKNLNKKIELDKNKKVASDKKIKPDKKTVNLGKATWKKKTYMTKKRSEELLKGNVKLTVALERFNIAAKLKPIELAAYKSKTSVEKNIETKGPITKKYKIGPAKGKEVNVGNKIPKSKNTVPEKSITSNKESQRKSVDQITPESSPQVRRSSRRKTGGDVADEPKNEDSQSKSCKEIENNLKEDESKASTEATDNPKTKGNKRKSSHTEETSNENPQKQETLIKQIDAKHDKSSTAKQDKNSSSNESAVARSTRRRAAGEANTVSDENQKAPKMQDENKINKGNGSENVTAKHSKQKVAGDASAQLSIQSTPNQEESNAEAEVRQDESRRIKAKSNKRESTGDKEASGHTESDENQKKPKQNEEKVNAKESLKLRSSRRRPAEPVDSSQNQDAKKKADRKQGEDSVNIGSEDLDAKATKGPKSVKEAAESRKDAPAMDVPEHRYSKRLRLSDNAKSTVATVVDLKTITKDHKGENVEGDPLEINLHGKSNEDVETIDLTEEIESNSVTIRKMPARGARQNKYQERSTDCKQGVMIKGVLIKGDVTIKIKEKTPVDEPKCIKKIVPLLTCVNIEKLMDPEKKNKAIGNVKNAARISSASSPLSVQSFGEDPGNNDASDQDVDNNSDVVIVEEDPLGDVAAMEPLSLSNFKLDSTEPSSTMTRSLRKRPRTDVEFERTMGESAGKRRKVKGKRKADLQLRKSIEEQKNFEISSSEEDIADKGMSPRKKTTFPSKDLQKRAHQSSDVDTASPIFSRIDNDTPLSVDDSTSAGSPAPILVDSSDSDCPSIPVRKRKPPKKRKKTLLGLDIPSDVDLLNDTETTIRHSRRIAQIKIREEADRRKLEEVASNDAKKKKKKAKKREDKDYKSEKRKKSKNLKREEDVVVVLTECEETEKKKKPKKRRKHKDPRKIFDESNPWRSSSDSSSSNEEEDEEEIVEYSEAESPLFKSDHEFSPESDVEEYDEAQPLKRARTARKEDDVAEDVDDHACQKCSKSDHPEWILLCDGCDNGWHCSCLRPALLVIPEGDWFCPPCQHNSLIKNLESKLVDYDKKLAKRGIEERRKERLAYVGISLANVLPVKDPTAKKQKRQQDAEESSETEESESESESSSESDSDEPIYQLRQRRQAHSYRFNDYDELINSAIQDEVDAKGASVTAAGNQGRGKDISTIVNAEKEEEEARQKQAQELEPLPPVVPVEAKKLPQAVFPPQQNDSDDEKIKPVRRLHGRKKHRKLNCLDVSSGDDQESDEDFKGSSSAEEEDEYEEAASDSSEGYGRRKDSGAIRRSTRARVSRYDKEFLNDNSEDDAPRKKKTKAPWDDSDSEETDQSWGRRKKKSGSKRRLSVSKRRRSKKNRKFFSDSDNEVHKKKKRIIKYGGLDDDDDEEDRGRRTRGKRINYIDALASDSDEEVRKRPPPRIESDDEYDANEEQDLHDEDDDEEGGRGEEENGSEENASRPVSEPKESALAASNSETVIASNKNEESAEQKFEATITEKDAKTTPEKELEKLSLAQMLEEQDNEDDESELNPIEAINKNLEQMDEKEMEMMMEEEEYANKQLQLMALQLEKEKKRREREAKRLEIMMVQEKVPKKRGRKPKSALESPEVVRKAKKVAHVPALQVGPDMRSNSELSEPLGVTIPIFSEIPPTNITPEGTPKKRRGRGKGKKTLEKEQAAAAAAAGFTFKEGMDSSNSDHIPLTIDSLAGSSNNSHSPSSNSPMLGGKLTVATPPQPFSQSQPAPSVITRMLQSQSGQGNFGLGMSHKYYSGEQALLSDAPPGSGSPISGPPPQGQYMHGGSRGLTPSYRQPPPGMNPYPVAARGSPAPAHRLRVPQPQGIPPMYHTHHPLDPSPSGGGPINVPVGPMNMTTSSMNVATGGLTSADRNSPGAVPPTSDSPLSHKSDQTPPPPPYTRPPMSRFPPTSNSPLMTSPVRHPQLLPPQHMQQARPGVPYPAMPPNYYNTYMPPNMGEESLPLPSYQYPEQFSEGSSPQGSSKAYEEENSGEFGGLVSYFSSQREDDLDT